MKITGQLSDEEFLEYISLRLKLESLINFVNSKEYTDSEKVAFMRIYLKEGK